MRCDIKEVRSLETLGGWRVLAPDTSCWSMQTDAGDMLTIAGQRRDPAPHADVKGDQGGLDQLIHGPRHDTLLISKDTA